MGNNGYSVLKGNKKILAMRAAGEQDIKIIFHINRLIFQKSKVFC